MAQYTHKGQILPLVNQMIPIDKETTFHASYDYHLNGMNQEEAIEPIGSERVYKFNGSDSRINFPIGAGINPYNQKVEVSMKVCLSDTNTQIIIASNRDLNGSARFYIGINGGKWTFALQGSNWTSSDLVPAVVNQWAELYLIAYNGSATLYVDGVATGIRTYTSYSIYDFGLGWNNGYSDLYTTAMISDLKIKVDDNTIGYYKMNEKEGPISFDSSENGNDGQWNGGIISTYGPTVATLKKEEGKFRGAVLIEPDTINLASYTDFSNKTFGVPQAIGGWGGDQANMTYYSGGGYNNLPYMKMNKTAGGDGGSYMDEYGYFQIADSKTYTISAWMKASQNVTVVGYALCINRPSDNVYRVPPNLNLTTEWKRYSWVYTAGVGHAGDYVHRGIIYVDENLPIDIYWCGFQVEEREGATSYTVNKRPLGKLWYTKELINPEGFTISCWFNVPYMHRVATNNGGINTNWFHPIMEVATSTNGSQSFGLVAGPEPSSYSRKLALQAPVTGTSTFPVQDNTWYHMVTTYNGTTYKVYIDGVEQISAAGPAIPITEGQYLMVGGGFRGKPNIMIDELRIESRAISLEEVEAWAASGIHYNYLDYSSYVD